RAAAVERQVDAPGPVLVEDRPRVGRVDASEVEALRQADDVPRETVAADVAALPHPVRVGLIGQGLVDGPTVARAAAVVLAVRAGQEQRMPDRLARRREV